jgi:hypothetical protein
VAPHYTAESLPGKIIVMAERLTESLIKALTAPQRGERFLWDAELTGFAVKIFAPTKAHPQGARTFILSYWIDGRERRYRIGSSCRGKGDPATGRPR